MRTLPTAIHIGGKRVRISIVGDLDSWGEYHHDRAEILIASRCLTKASLVRETLRHEIMHAALAISGVGFMTTYAEEAVVRCMDEIFWPCWDRICGKLGEIAE